MTTYLVVVLATTLPWLGWFMALRTVFYGAKFVTGTGDRSPFLKGMGISAFLAGLSFVLGGVLGQSLGLPAATGYRLPITWFVMPFSSWLLVASIGFVALRAGQAFQALTSIERLDRLKAAGVWLLAAGLCAYLYYRDPENEIKVIKGAIPFSTTTLAALVALAVATVVAMVLSDRTLRTRGIVKTVATQIALVVGSVVFGLPFAFLLVTSFKEDRDMSSPKGIVWVPHVQETVPYMDPKNPLYEGEFRGQTVQGSVVERRGDGTAVVDIFKPMAIRGTTFEAKFDALKEVPKDAPLVKVAMGGQEVKGMVIEDLEDGRKRVEALEPATLKGKQEIFEPAQTEPIRKVGLRVANYFEALDFLPPETDRGLVYLKNTLILVLLSVIGTVFSSSIVAYAFSRLRFPGRELLFNIMLSTMMLPAAVTLLPQFLIFRTFGWVDTLYPLWVPAFFGNAFNIFLLRQFFKNIPMELEEAAKIDGCTYLRTFWGIMLPQIKPALAVIAVGTVLGAWNNFMGPLIYINSPENMPLSYALQLFQGDRGGEPGLLMAFATMCMLPVLALFFFAQRYFIEGVTLSGFGGR